MTRKPQSLTHALFDIIAYCEKRSWSNLRLTKLFDEQQPPQHQPDSLLRPSQAATYLGMAVKTLANDRVYGRGPAYEQRRPGGPILYRFSVLQEFKIATTRSSTSDWGKQP